MKKSIYEWGGTILVVINLLVFSFFFITPLVPFLSKLWMSFVPERGLSSGFLASFILFILFFIDTLGIIIAIIRYVITHQPKRFKKILCFIALIPLAFIFNFFLFAIIPLQYITPSIGYILKTPSGIIITALLEVGIIYYLLLNKVKIKRK